MPFIPEVAFYQQTVFAMSGSGTWHVMASHESQLTSGKAGQHSATKAQLAVENDPDKVTQI